MLLSTNVRDKLDRFRSSKSTFSILKVPKSQKTIIESNIATNMILTVPMLGERNEEAFKNPLP